MDYNLNIFYKFLNNISKNIHPMFLPMASPSFAISILTFSHLLKANEVFKSLIFIFGFFFLTSSNSLFFEFSYFRIILYSWRFIKAFYCFLMSPQIVKGTSFIVPRIGIPWIYTKYPIITFYYLLIFFLYYLIP